MLRLFSLTALGAMALAQAADAQPADPDMLVEGKAMAHRSVTITREELADPAALASIARKLRLAARGACAEQYPSEAEYLFMRACVSESFEGALAEVRADQTRTARRAAAHTIAVNAHAQ